MAEFVMDVAGNPSWSGALITGPERRSLLMADREAEEEVL